MRNILEAPFLTEMVRTAEKAAEIYMKIAHLPRRNTITDGHLHQLERHFGVTARDGWLAP